MWSHKSVLKLINESESGDPIIEIKERARNIVFNALDKGWIGPPYNTLELAKILGIELMPSECVYDASIIPIRKGKIQIQYNPFQKLSRINFSIAHEIGHTLFSDCEEEVRNREIDPLANRQLERLCNIAAAEILLPFGVFSSDVNSVDATIEGLLSLATKYNASLESVFLRYIEVVDKHCAIVVGFFDDSTGFTIDYWKPSRNFSYNFNDSFFLPKGSKILESCAPGWTSREIMDLPFLDNIPHEFFSIGLSSYKRDNKQRIALLITPLGQDIDTKTNKIVLEYGDATKPRGNDIKIIAQIVNTSAATGLGFGKSLVKNYPIVKQELDNWHFTKSNFKLGESNLVKVRSDLYVFQMLAQKGLFPKAGEIPLKYQELRKCLIELADTAHNLNASVHMPQIGAGQAKGDWNCILGIIYEELIAKDIKVNIYLLPGKVYNPRTRNSLIVFKEDSTWTTGELF